MAFISVTRLRIRALRFMPAFFFHTVRTQRQVRHAAGYLDGALLADRKRTYWTMTLWRDPAAMRAYMASGAHLRAMPKLLHWCDEASVVHWDTPEPRLPLWEEADSRMRAQGRASKVRHPGPRHATLAYEAPRASGAVPLKPQRTS